MALKLEETCLRPACGLSYADLRHGPIAVVRPGLVAVLLAAADGPFLAGMTTLADDPRRHGARVLGMGGDQAFRDMCDVSLPGPALGEGVAPLALALSGQLVVEALARRLGLDSDAPPGLAKLTQTDT